MNITLATLPTASPQQVFDQVAKHLLTQMAESKDSNGTCAYHSPTGLKCAAGCLISDEEYFKLGIGEVESYDWPYLVEKEIATPHHQKLIRNLQMVHDDYKPSEWKQRLREVAAHFHLEFKPMEATQ